MMIITLEMSTMFLYTLLLTLGLRALVQHLDVLLLGVAAEEPRHLVRLAGGMKMRCVVTPSNFPLSQNMRCFFFLFA